jgi:hypothetical protein
MIHFMTVFQIFRTDNFQGESEDVIFLISINQIELEYFADYMILQIRKA